MPKIATLRKIELRDVWPGETQFSDWLAENLVQLGDELGLELERSEREKAVGAFSADVICVDRDSKADVVIENQFTQADHAHLGKMITYASGLQSQIIIWVAEKFRDEHLSAINWLNDISGPETGFFGVVIKAFQIGDSDFAPHFQIVAKPNNWQRHVRRASSSSRGVPSSETALKLKSFWEDLREHFELKRSPLELGKTKYDHKHRFKFGVPANSLRAIFEHDATEFRVEIFLSGRKKRPEYSRDWIDHLKASRDEIEEVAGEPLDWDNPDQNVEISISYRPEPVDIDDPKARQKVIEQIYDKVDRLHKAFRPHVESFFATHGPL